MRRVVAVLVLLVCPVFAAELTLNERAYLASRIYASLANFAHWQDAQGVDIEAGYRRYLEKALAGADQVGWT